MNDDLREIEDAREREHYSLDPRDQPFAEDEPEEERELLDDFDIAAINAVRTLLVELQERCQKLDASAREGWTRDWIMRAAGNTQGRAEVLEDNLFQLLNYAKHHLDVPMSDNQLHNKGEGA